MNVASVIMRSINTRAFIACNSTSLRFSCDVEMNTSYEVSLTGITFVNTSLYFDECSVKMVDCSFVNGSNNARSIIFARNSAGNIFVDSCSFQNNSASGLKISGNSSVNLVISNSSFVNNNLSSINDTILAMSSQNLQVQQFNKFTINVTNTALSHNSCPGHACLEIDAGVKGELALHMDEVIFEHNKVGESVLDVRGSSNAYVEFKSTQFRENSGRAVKLSNGIALELKIVKGTFVHNEIGQRGNGGAVSISGFTQKAFVYLSQSNFTSNEAKNGGALAFVKIFFLMLDIEDCQFVQNEARGVSLPQNNATIDISLEQSCRDHCSVGVGEDGGGALFLHINYVHNFSLTNNSFVGNKAEKMDSGAIQAHFTFLYTDAVVSNCEFIRNSGTLALVVTDTSPSQPRVIIQNSKFFENKGENFYDINLLSSNVTIRSCAIQSNSGGGILFGTCAKNVNILVENSLISDNVNFVLYLHMVKYNYASAYQFKNVSFKNNDCKVGGTLFGVSMYSSQSSLIFQASKFLNNSCKSGVVKISVKQSVQSRAFVDSNTRVTVNNTEFRGNSGVSKSTLKILNVRTIDILNSNFTNNFGGADGSHMRVQMRTSELTIYNTSFHQFKKSQNFNASREQPYNGFLTVTSAGNMSIRKSSFISDPLSGDGKTLIFVKGAHNVFMNDSVRIESPVSSKLSLHNFSHWELGAKFPKTFITSFSLSTEPCPMGSYSINRGSSNGFTIKNHVKCLSCPTGGNCSTSLSARHNFWGYPMSDKVYFKFCPQGYCCPAVNQSCPYHNSSYLHSGCQGNRTGILCGRCKQNFSETLFSTNCLPVNECTHWWYLIIIFICTTSFALFLIHKPPVLEILMTNLTWFLARRERKDHSLDSDAKTDSGQVEIQAQTNSGFLKILFYFYQIAGVLTASYYGVDEVLKDNIVLPVISLLDFKITVNNDWNICPFPGITPLSKTLLQLAAVMAIFLSIPAIYLMHSGLKKLRKRTSELPSCGPYLGASLEILLLGYSVLTDTAMKLLTCVKIQHVSRWYYDADITCYQWWQCASLGAIALFLIPFVFTLYFSSSQLYQGQISSKIFLLACLFPFPYLLLRLIFYVVKVITRPRNYQEMKSSSSMFDHEDDKDAYSPSNKEHSAVLEVLTAPFCKPKDGQSSGRKIGPRKSKGKGHEKFRKEPSQKKSQNFGLCACAPI